MSAPSMNQPSHPGPYFTSPQVQPGPSPLEQSSKRKAESGDAQTPQRSKRNRYISIACNECKRRKIKCNGQNPCQRCEKLELECVYAPNCCSSNFKESEEFRAMNAHIASLQQQVHELWSQLHAMRSGQATFPLHPSLSNTEDTNSYRNSLETPPQPRASQPQFQGPTSSAFNLDVAKSSLQTMGITQPENHDEGDSADIDPSLDVHDSGQAPVAAMLVRSDNDPLQELSKDDAIRLCRLYNEEIGMMYPMVDIEKIVRHADQLYSQMDASSRATSIGPAGHDHIQLDSSDISILRMVLASALMAQGGGQSALGRSIYESCRPAFECQLTGHAEIKGLILLVIVAEYHFQEDEEIQAYRIIGLATRLCLEMGLHRRPTLMKLFGDEEERKWAVKLFWSIYVLDRRWSFGTGIPFALQDADIDPALPDPDVSAPYLTAMISYSRISAKIWRTTSNFGGAPVEVDEEALRALDMEMLRWHSGIEDSLKFDPSKDSFFAPPGISRGQRRLHIILYLRLNQMRMLVYRPVLHSATTIMENRMLAQCGVDVAKDTIRVLTRLNESTDIYSTQQVCFNYFLLSALAVIFLAVSHAPVEFSHQVQDEFYQALDLVKGFSTHSYISKKLWRAISGLREIAPKLGLVHRHAQILSGQDAHSSAAVTMAGLAGHRVEEFTASDSPSRASALTASPINGQQMTNELTNLFEAAKVYSSGPVVVEDQGMEDATASNLGATATDNPRHDRLSGVYGSEGDLSRIMGVLF